MRLVPNTPAKEFTLSAIIIGYILLDDMTPAEQNSLGNWFMLIGQVLCTNSSQQQVLNNRNNNSNSTNEHIINDSFGSDYNTQFDSLKRAVNKVSQEVNKF